jgi:hypothetical protein
MRLLLTIVTVAIMVAGCAPQHSERQQYSPSRAPIEPYALTDAHLQGIMDGVRQGLKDPYSAQFGRIGATQDTTNNTAYVCGEVNAKNSFGSYAGMSPFSGMLFPQAPELGFALLAIADVDIAVDDIDEQVILQQCAQHGLDWN